MNNYIIAFYNRFACQTQTVEIKATNLFRAGREFYRQFDRKIYMEKIESIKESVKV